MKFLSTTTILFLMMISLSIRAELVAQPVDYIDGEVTLKGYLAYDNSVEKQRPGVLVVHEWWGHNEYARKRARMLAKLGYTALAVDMYGEGKSTQHPKEAKQFMMQALKNAETAKSRFIAALNLLKAHKTVNPEQIAAIGYCFGGGVVLEMARRGVDLIGVASFHGSLDTKIPAQAGEVTAKVLVLHGEADQFISPEKVEAFKKEMETAKVDLEFVGYPGVEHSFTNPDADKFAKELGLPLAYDKAADQASWEKLQTFFQTIFVDKKLAD